MPSDIAHYKIFRADDIDGPFSQIGTSLTTSFTDSTAIPGNTYCYYIVAVDIYDNESTPSPVSCVFFSNNQQIMEGAVISPLNVAVVYRQGDSESLEFAQRYQALHGLLDGQLVPVPCSAIEVLADYGTFQDEVETPLSAAMASDPLANFTIYAIVLMPRVPGGFRHEENIISSTSRLSRIGHTFSKKLHNPLYDRKVFDRYGGTDITFARICTRFDSPNAAVTADWFTNTERAAVQLFSTGNFYLDPYSAVRGKEAERYESELLFFEDTLLRRLGLGIITSFQVDPYVDPVIPSVADDSFVWTWGTERGGLTFFKTSTALRSFFYNADTTGAETMRDMDQRNWPLLAIRQGYVTSAGSMSDPGVDGYMRPTPFFDALFRSATVGEAMLFSTPYVDWTTAHFGDPLLLFSFPQNFNTTAKIPFDKSWQEMANCEAESIVNIYRKSLLVDTLWNYVMGGTDEDVADDIADPAENLRNDFNSTSWKNDYIALTKAMFNVVTIRHQTDFQSHYPNLAYYLDLTDNKVTDIALDTLQNEAVRNSIDSSKIEVRGSWDFSFDLEHTPGTFAFYHFELEVSDTEDFEEVLLSKDSFQDQTGWLYEDSEGDFQPLPSNGLTSNYAGKNVRYVSQNGENLERGFYYFFRIRQKDQLTTFGPRDFRQVIYR